MSAADHLFDNYVRAPVAFSHGEGTRLWDTEGREYLDFIGGIAVNALGHNHPRLVAAICEQAGRYLHVSNLYRIPEQEAAAARLVEVAGAGSGLDRVFFCNSGTEANEAAIKLARKVGSARGANEIVSTWNGFHGRTLGALAATGTKRYHEGFGPLPEGFTFIDYNDLDGARRQISERTCAVLVETVQGEGGVNPGQPEFLEGLRELCSARGCLLIFDEVQTGVGRLGEWFGFQLYDVEPDVLTLAKGLGGGVPIGAVMAKAPIAEQLVPGDHGCTFGGNPLACRAAKTVLDVIEEDGLLEHVRAMGRRLRSALETVPGVVSVRGAGLLVAADLDTEAAPIVGSCLERGLLVNAVRPSSIRFAPPLTVQDAEIDAAVERLATAVAERRSSVAEPA